MGPNRARVESELGRISIWASFGLSDRSKAKGPPSLLGRRFAPTRSPLEAVAASSPRWTSPFSSSNTPPSPSPPSLSLRCLHHQRCRIFPSLSLLQLRPRRQSKSWSMNGWFRDFVQCLHIQHTYQRIILMSWRRLSHLR